MSAQDKAGLRRSLRRARQSLGKNERARAELAANRFLKRHIRRNGRIGIYWPIGSELRLNGFIQTALTRGAKLYLPYIEPHSLRLWFTPYQADGRKAERRHSRGSLAIPQFSGSKIRAHRLNVLLVPLVGIDRQGYRLGQGGGYYDVTLAALKGRLKPHTVGAGFACQLCGSLPHEAHDIALDAFVSEAGIMRFSAQTPA
ncbi:5-formyltetrahydrofolate cyclo-ligase [Neisseria dentiae]|uniref:5-formyltetrahydrofolate cyclo-ligase n=1 Tax=Neisseria dentiae TaxID=194197 RepID=A0A1X3D390_9NEIS|nr:5-formyltetrahydrofolate cyclo-ligase [Neisseria dentiae]OSI14370.1 5-formyltetrahydrofolate cyclo-ligase [Neisseria dentiae]QMT45049.1 5-formyltetrahydrofolate cyclo-ligase [Neisseria dentiae]STZ50799.1 5-formyltetrahydrofolate cyclo-ligase [Neisseria dentiae]